MDPAPAHADQTAQALSADVSRRDFAVRLGAGGLAALLLAAGQRPTALAAQDATPGATPAGATGTTAQVLGSGQPASAPGLELSLRRIVHAPGGQVPPHSHPGALVIFVEAGTWGYTPLGGTVRLTRAGAATPAAGGTPAAAEALPIGTEVLLTAGDWLFFEPTEPTGSTPTDVIRNAGDDDVVLLIAGLTRVGEPFTRIMTEAEMAGMGAEATPAP